MKEPEVLFPGITLRCFPDDRFKHGCLSVQLVRPMCREEAASNALLPAVLLRGCESCPDLRAITLRLDDLYGAAVGALVRRVGDWQTTGLYCSFMEDRFAMEGDAILAPMVEFMAQLLLEPVTVDGGFAPDFVESEKKNLISSIESQLNDKRAYAMEQMMRILCREDTFGLPRLGEKEEVAAITPQSLYAHYQKILVSSRIELCHVGSAEPETVKKLLMPVFAGLARQYMPLPAQTPLRIAQPGSHEQTMEVSQGKLCMGFVTPVTLRHEGFVAMQLFNVIFGGGMTSKLFTRIREQMSLCYAIGSGYHGSKGIVTVSAGIDSGLSGQVQQEVLAQLQACKDGSITQRELEAAKQALRSALLSSEDSPGALENYYATAALSGQKMTVGEYITAVEQTTPEQVVAAANTVALNTVYFLKGVR